MMATLDRMSAAMCGVLGCNAVVVAMDAKPGIEYVVIPAIILMVLFAAKCFAIVHRNESAE